MRTRRSPKNQERLWQDLGERKAVPQPLPVRTDAEIDAMWWLSRRARSMLKADAAKRRARE